MRRIVFVTLAAVLILLPPVIHVPRPAAHAQNNDEWFAYVVHVNSATTDQDLIRIDGQGNTQVYDSPLPLSTGLVGFSPDGKYLSYCLPEDDASLMVMWDIEGERPMWTRNFGPTNVCGVSYWAFSDTGDWIAVGIGSDSDHAGDGPRWRIVVLDVSNGDIVSELNDQMESVIAFGLDVFGDVVLFPYVRRVSENELIFVLQHGPDSEALQAYRWAWEGDSVEIINYWGTRICSFLPSTGELLFIELDGTTSRPNQLPVGNSLKIADATGVRTVYRQADVSIIDATFVNDGQEILVTGLFPATKELHLVLISRDGTLHPLDIVGFQMPAFAAPGGFAVVTVPSDTKSPYAAALELHHGNDVEVLWKLERNPDLLLDVGILTFSLSTPAAPDLPPFPEMTPP